MHTHMHTNAHLHTHTRMHTHSLSHTHILPPFFFFFPVKHYHNKMTPIDKSFCFTYHLLFVQARWHKDFVFHQLWVTHRLLFSPSENCRSFFFWRSVAPSSSNETNIEIKEQIKVLSRKILLILFLLFLLYLLLEVLMNTFFKQSTTFETVLVPLIFLWE